MIEERLDRQLRIKGWDQAVLSGARVCVLGDNDLLASLFVLSASALGINDLFVLAPRLDEDLIENARRLNPKFNLSFLDGYYTHAALDDIFSGCELLVDLSRYGLANKLAVNRTFRAGSTLVRAFNYQDSAITGIRAFTYMRGREWEELESVVSADNFPRKHPDDPVLSTLAAGIALEEVKNILMGWRVSSQLISYLRDAPDGVSLDPNVLVIGAGSLGNFVALGLAWSGIRRITFIDPDLVEVANLNRQVLFHDAIGRGKAETLATRLNKRFGTAAEYISRYFKRNTDISPFDVVFDCVDNFETRILISEKCADAGKVLISGGTSPTAGQAVFFNPLSHGPTPAQLLGLYEIAGKRRLDQVERVRESCRYHPDPSVIMTNQIIAALMVDAFRIHLSGRTPGNIFYDSESDEKILS